jgi:RNA polymerase sigma factor for flagellar operon FliA
MWLRVRGAMTIVRAVDGRQAQLVERHLGVARRAAALIYPRVRGHVAFDEVVALANAGLAEAAARYDPDRGAAFTTFAWYRIHGAIVDGLRRSTELPRRTWARLVALRTASDYLELRAPPSGGELLAAIAGTMSSVRVTYPQSLETLCERGFDAPADAPAPGDAIDSGRNSARLRDALARLPDKPRAIVTKHYFEGKSLLEAGAELGLSKSWASRLHAQAVDKLRALLDEDDDGG